MEIIVTTIREHLEYQIIGLIIVHFIGDFLLQSDKMSLNKSKNNYWLLTHVFVYSMTWFFFGIMLFDFIKVITFVGITFLCHFITDYITSRLTSYYYKKKDNHNFFVIVGIDQVLHYIQLIITYLRIFV